MGWLCVNLYFGQLCNLINWIGIYVMYCITSKVWKKGVWKKCNKKKRKVQGHKQYKEQQVFIYHSKVILHSKVYHSTNQVVDQRSSYCFILTSGSVKSFNKVDLTVFCKNLFTECILHCMFVNPFTRWT